MPGLWAPALARFAHHFFGPLHALVDLNHVSSDDLLLPIPQQGLGPRAEEGDVSLSIGGDDGIGGAFQERAQICLGGPDLIGQLSLEH